VVATILGRVRRCQVRRCFDVVNFVTSLSLRFTVAAIGEVLGSADPFPKKRKCKRTFPFVAVAKVF